MSDLFLIVFTIVVVFFSGFWAGTIVGSKQREVEAVSKGYACHNSTNGNWRWIEPSTNR